MAGPNPITRVGRNLIVAGTIGTHGGVTSYTTGDVVGGKITFTGAGRWNKGSGLVRSVLVTSKSDDITFTSFDLALFRADLVGTYTDNAAFAGHDTDMQACIGVASASTLLAFTGGEYAQATGLALPFDIAADTTALYGVLIIRGSGALTDGDISVRLGISQD